MSKKHDYRQIISEIGDHYCQPGEDWDVNLVEGLPTVISRRDALRIAKWLETEAEYEWGADDRYKQIADDIRTAVHADR